jgi:hypothetical protein
MIKTSGRKHRNTIFRLCHEDSFIEGDENLLEYAVGYYKGLFCHISLLHVSLYISTRSRFY